MCDNPNQPQVARLLHNQRNVSARQQATIFHRADVAGIRPAGTALIKRRAIGAGIDQRATGQRHMVRGQADWIQGQRAELGVETGPGLAVRQHTTVVGREVMAVVGNLRGAIAVAVERARILQHAIPKARVTVVRAEYTVGIAEDRLTRAPHGT